MRALGPNQSGMIATRRPPGLRRRRAAWRWRTAAWASAPRPTDRENGGFIRITVGLAALASVGLIVAPSCPVTLAQGNAWTSRARRSGAYSLSWRFAWALHCDRKSVVWGRSGAVRLDRGGRRSN